jgi:hypothetical protein
MYSCAALVGFVDAIGVGEENGCYFAFFGELGEPEVVFEAIFLAGVVGGVSGMWVLRLMKLWVIDLLPLTCCHVISCPSCLEEVQLEHLLLGVVGSVILHDVFWSNNGKMVL